MWVYSQSSGHLFRDGKLVGTGYSGSPAGKNNPLMQALKSTGPIPQGRWRIVGPPVDTNTHGPYALHLVPDPLTNTFGRSNFLIHGDNVSDPGNGSEGCIVLPPALRHLIWDSGDRNLLVVACDTDLPLVC